MRAWILVVFLVGCGSAVQGPPTVASVDLSRYEGTWYEVYTSDVDNEFEADDGSNTSFGQAEGACFGTTITYTREGEGVRLLNRCWKGSLSGPEERIGGVATPVDDTNARLKVRFDPLYLQPFTFDYFVYWLDDDYELVMLGQPEPPYIGSILSRTRTPDPDKLAAAFDYASSLGLDPERTLYQVVHPDP